MAVSAFESILPGKRQTSFLAIPQVIGSKLISGDLSGTSQGDSVLPVAGDAQLVRSIIE